jgi:hypothetical protein
MKPTYRNIAQAVADSTCIDEKFQQMPSHDRKFILHSAVTLLLTNHKKKITAVNKVVAEFVPKDALGESCLKVVVNGKSFVLTFFDGKTMCNSPIVPSRPRPSASAQRKLGLQKQLTKANVLSKHDQIALRTADANSALHYWLKK